MSLVEVLAKRAMEFRMDDAQIRIVGSIKLSDAESDALAKLLEHIEAESWDLGYDDAMIDTLAPKKGGGK